MKRFATLEELRETPIAGGLVGGLARVLCSNPGESTRKHDEKENGPGAWLLQSTDTDITVTEILGAPLCTLEFERVSYHPDHEHFVCRLEASGERGAFLVVPDVHWLPEVWRERLLGQL